MNTRKLVSLLFLTALFAALINTRMFTQPTTASFFFFTITASVTVVMVGVGLLLRKQPAYFSYPLHLILLHALGVYISIDGLITGTWSITHNYWLITILYFTCAHLVYEKYKDNKGDITYFLLKGMIWITLFESLVVILQSVHVLPSWSTAFSATGTWSNPNVTAMYLSVSLYLTFHAFSRMPPGKWKGAAISTILTALVLLQCRTAFLVALLAILMYYRYNIRNWLLPKVSLPSRIVAPLVILITLSAAAIVFLKMKEGSASGRLLVYENSLMLVEEHPFAGNGFGLFEKHYNRYVAEHNLPSNGDVSMAYNDFIEILVEGGIMALLLWTGFLVTCAIWTFRKRYSLFPVIAFIIIQSVNFGFQAVPVFALLLLAIAFPLPVGKEDQPAVKNVRADKQLHLFKKGIGVPMILLSLLLGICQLKVAIAWRELHEIPPPQYAASIYRFEGLEATLQRQSYFHEQFGDAWLRKGNAQRANEEYKKALQYCSFPPVLVKYGYSFQAQNKYDSSLYYYQLAGKIEPFKFATRMVILKMYEQKKDTVNIKMAAKNILAMPVKVESEKVDRIKQYANNILSKIK